MKRDFFSNIHGAKLPGVQCSLINEQGHNRQKGQAKPGKNLSRCGFQVTLFPNLMIKFSITVAFLMKWYFREWGPGREGVKRGLYL